MAHPLEGKAAIDEFILTADAQQILGDRYDQVKAQLASVNEALAQGGDVHSEALGQQVGGVLAVFVNLVVGGEANVAKGASILSKAGIDVSSSSYKAIAADTTAASIQGEVDKLQTIAQSAESPKGPKPVGNSGGKPTLEGDPYNPTSVSERIEGNRDLYGRENLGPSDPKWLEVKQDQVAELRAKLPDELKTRGNVAVADIYVDGLPTSMAAHSGVSKAADGFVGTGSEGFLSKVVKNAEGAPTDRVVDSEYKILDNISDMLGDNRLASGTIDIFSELKVCDSCSGVISQFRERFPNINVNVVANPNGRRVLKD